MNGIDHIVVSANSLAEGVAHVEAALGVTLAGGGKHALMSTHNRLLGLGDLYLEVIAIDPEAPPPGRPRWFDLDHFAGPPRLTNWVAQAQDLPATLALCPPGLGKPVEMTRGAYRWDYTVPADGRLPFDGAFPALLHWHGRRPPDDLPDCGLRLTRFDLIHPQADALRTALGAIIDDDRITVTQGPAKALRATFDGPSGPRVLA
ncbi:VOC family protein [Neotabrizicola shimadae]|uniref:VOC family protein n=1 Tax=Neotabrizicola shimadae TaxID=2807096 RepID=A0A8G1ECY6_9RHOB|nr:VOC family protein [Neotabrizicola shimadae]QYZ71125.1 VOC family protein [Neotabrizicola shimadae]